MASLHLTVLVILSSVGVAAACPNTAGVVIGSILGTLVVVGIVIAIIFFLRHKKLEKAKEEEERRLGGNEHSYVNPSFETTELYSPTPTKQIDESEETAVHTNKGFKGYVECRNYDSPNKGKLLLATKENDLRNGGSSSARRNLSMEFQTSSTKPGPLQKSGSHGSLDNSFNAMDPETVSVRLESQDIIGLGFNICGNLRDGIYVREVLNRGPANESGLIKAGDRILSITISFENMVFEDALTILSYASPYPVKLKLQKSVPLLTDEASEDTPQTEAIGDLHHPLYKSQSMDDIRQITQDGLQGPRRTYSEMKRNGPLPKSVEEGHLRKWKNKAELVNEESSASEADYAHSSVSNFSIPDLKMDMGDLSRKIDMDNKTGSSEKVHPTVVDLHLPDANLEKAVSLNEIPAEKIDEFMQRKASSEMNLKTESVIVHHVVPKEKEANSSPKHENVEEVIHHLVEPEVAFCPEVKQDDVKIELDDSLEVKASMPSPMSEQDVSTDTVIFMEKSDVAPMGRKLLVKVNEGGEDIEKCVQDGSVQIDKSPEIEVTVPEPSVTIETETSPSFSRRKRKITGESTSSVESSDKENEKERKLDENKNAEMEVDVEVLKEKIAFIENDIEDNPGQIDFMDVDLNGDFGPKPPIINLNSHPQDFSTTLHAGTQQEEDGVEEDQEEVVEIEEDQMRAVLRDYFGDQPSLLQQFGMAKHVQNHDGMDQQKTITIETRTISTVESPDSGVMEEKKGSVSDSPSSSRSLSPHIEGESAENNKKSDSPRIRRKSGGGVAFDITATEFEEFPDEVPQEPRGEPKGGIAYYVHIDDQHNPTPANPPQLSKEDFTQPPLVKPAGWDQSKSTSYHIETSQTNHVDDNRLVRTQKVETVHISPDGNSRIETKTSKMTVNLHSDNDDKDGVHMVTIGDSLNDSEA